MKKKILSFILGIFLSIFSVFSLVSCSLVQVDTEKINSKVVLKVDDTTFTKNDILNSFYSYYQNNSSAFSYGNIDENTIVDSFYTWVIIKQMIADLAEKELKTDENPTGHYFYTQDDADEIWKSVKDYLYSQVTAYEKVIYQLEKEYEDDDMPSWIKATEEEKEDEVFSSFKSSKPEVDNSGKVTVPKLSKQDVVDFMESDKLFDYLMEYVVETDDDGEETRASISALEETDTEKYRLGARRDAFTKYISTLVSTAKAEGKDTTVETLFENEVYRIYEAYYNSKLTSLFQQYYLNEYMTNANGVDGDKVALSDETIAKVFLEQYYTDKQKYQSESNYVTDITSSNGTPLILFHYDGRDYFFTVQHIILNFSNPLIDEIKKIEGYPTSSSSDLDATISEYFKSERKSVVNEHKKSVLVEINEKNNFDLIEIEGAHYYFDEDKVDVYDETKEIYYGYTKVTKVSGEETFEDLEGNKYDSEDVKFMANIDDVIACYNKTSKKWAELAEDYFNGTKTKTEILTELNIETKEEYTEDYIFETIDIMKGNGSSLDEVVVKLDKMLFVELEWIYSGDSLSNKLSSKIGYAISNYDDENGSWTEDFVQSAREIVENIKSMTDAQIASYIKGGTASNLTTTAIVNSENYSGYHIIKINDIYTNSSKVVDFDETLIDFSDGSTFVPYIIDILKNTFVTSASNETLYDYFYESLYELYVGNDSKNGTYMLEKEYNWISEKYYDGKIEIIEKLSYSELMDSLS